VKSTALPAKLEDQVDCFMTLGYLAGKMLRTSVLHRNTQVLSAIWSD